MLTVFTPDSTEALSLLSRIRDNRDKPSVENTVGHVATWVIAGLRHHRFATLAELRAAVYERVRAYNAEPFQKRQGSRLSVFDAEERPLLRPLPAVPLPDQPVGLWAARGT